MKALFLLFLVALMACGSPSTPKVTAPVASSAPPPVPPPPRPLQAPNIEVLKLAMRDLGFEKAQVSAFPDGRVAVMNFSLTKVPSSKSMEETFTAFIAKDGDQLGFGVIGAPRLNPPDLRPPLVAVGGWFPAAERCPNLFFEAAFMEMENGLRTPVEWIFGCPSMRDSADAFAKHKGSIARMSAELVPPDPFVTWLRSTEHMVFEDRDAVRQRGQVSVYGRGPAIAPGDRVALVQAFAQRAASAEKLPPLDLVELGPQAPMRGDARPLAERFSELTLRIAKPPLDGACIDPRVEVRIFDNTKTVLAGAPSMHVERVTVTCEGEPESATTPPPDAGRTLPAAAGRTLPFVMLCDYYNYAWGYQHDGTVVDKRGDVYSFNGGPVSAARPRTSSRCSCAMRSITSARCRPRMSIASWPSHRASRPSRLCRPPSTARTWGAPGASSSSPARRLTRSSP